MASSSIDLRTYRIATSFTVDFGSSTPRPIRVFLRIVSTQTRKPYPVAIYRAEVTEQHKLSKKRFPEQERRQAQEETERLKHCEVERQVAREGNIEETHLAAESCQAKEPTRHWATSVPKQNGFSNGHLIFTSTLLQSLLGCRNRFSGDPAASTATTSTPAGDFSSETKLPGGSQ
ncbi:unnamed protein product [Mesocestoides corti]|uniref:Uncharacterized protein n=1 Tax=Mesocestoides corti TaxID=53468 RepID=A0A0R3UI09_MESCO|nr:unnamed protein product [Mesocestoides corti]